MVYVLKLHDSKLVSLIVNLSGGRMTIDFYKY